MKDTADLPFPVLYLGWNQCIWNSQTLCFKENKNPFLAYILSIEGDKYKLTQPGWSTFIRTSVADLMCFEISK